MVKALFQKRFERFRKDEDGSVSVEAIIIIPLLFWAIMAVFSYFDGYRQSALNLKAAYTIGDLISRETQEVDDTYIDTMQELMTMMVGSRTDVDIRISLIRFDEDDNRHYVNWSTVRGFTEELTDDNIGDLRDKLPPMPDADTLILVETSNLFVAPFNVGIDDIELDNFVFTRPRWTNQVAGSV